MPEQYKSSSEGAGTATLCLEATDVTGTHTVRVSEVESSVPAGVLAAAIAAQMSLPDDVPWVLRDDSTSAYLEDGKPVGDQVGTEAKLTISPRTHLG